MRGCRIDTTDTASRDRRDGAARPALAAGRRAVGARPDRPRARRAQRPLRARRRLAGRGRARRHGVRPARVRGVGRAAGLCRSLDRSSTTTSRSGSAAVRAAAGRPAGRDLRPLARRLDRARLRRADRPRPLPDAFVLSAPAIAFASRAGKRRRRCFARVAPTAVPTPSTAASCRATRRWGSGTSPTR